MLRWYMPYTTKYTYNNKHTRISPSFVLSLTTAINYPKNKTEETQKWKENHHSREWKQKWMHILCAVFSQTDVQNNINISTSYFVHSDERWYNGKMYYHHIQKKWKKTKELTGKPNPTNLNVVAVFVVQ